MERVECKNWAKDSRKKHQWDVFKAVFLTAVISGAMEGVTSQISNKVLALLLDIVAVLVTFVLGIGLTKFMIAIKDDKKANISDLFFYFSNSFKNVLITGLYQTVMILLHTLLLIVPGIIKAFSYALVPYLLVDNPDKNYKEICDLSQKMMDGHKMDYFVLNLSFIGWHILGSLTLGILEIWILPYQQLAITKFLCEVKDNYKEK